MVIFIWLAALVMWTFNLHSAIGNSDTFYTVASVVGVVVSLAFSAFFINRAISKKYQGKIDDNECQK